MGSATSIWSALAPCGGCAAIANWAFCQDTCARWRWGLPLAMKPPKRQVALGFFPAQRGTRAAIANQAFVKNQVALGSALLTWAAQAPGDAQVCPAQGQGRLCAMWSSVCPTQGRFAATPAILTWAALAPSVCFPWPATPSKLVLILFYSTVTLMPNAPQWKRQLHPSPAAIATLCQVLGCHYTASIHSDWYLCKQ